MNTIVKNYKDKNGKVIGFGLTEDDSKINSLLASLSRNNTFMPNIERIVFNDPVTKVWFKDGTNVTIKTSEHDTFNKEVGICYALIKRLMGKPNDNGEIMSDGYMCELKRLVESAYDQKEIKAKKEAAKNEPKTKTETVKTEKKEKPSLRKCVSDLTETVEGLKNLVSGLVSK